MNILFFCREYPQIGLANDKELDVASHQVWVVIFREAI